MLKKLFIIFLLSSFASHAMAQKPKVLNYQEIDYKLIHFGFSLGLNTMDFNIKRNPMSSSSDSLFADLSKLQAGFNVNIVSELRLNSYLSVRCLPGLTFGGRKIVYYKSGTLDEHYDNIESNFIDLPILFKYRSARINNYRGYILFGASARYDLQARSEYQEDGENLIRLKRFDYYAEIGAGIDSYLEFFKFSTELKLAAGFRDVMVHTPPLNKPQYSNSISRLGSYLIILSFNFE